MPGSFVIKSRHQTTFHFRRRVPLDLVSAIGTMTTKGQTRRKPLPPKPPPLYRDSSQAGLHHLRLRLPEPPRLP